MLSKALNALGYAAVALLFTFALAVAARSEKPSQFIWQAEDGTYTNLPVTHGAVKQFIPSRDRWTPVTHTSPVHQWPRATYVARAQGDGEDFCREVYLGRSTGGGGVTVCGTERAVVFEQRVRRRHSLVTSTDTVLTVDGQEVMRVRGRRAQHDPGRTVVE